MLRFFSTATNSAGRTEEEPILIRGKRYSLWKGASAAKRLNLVGTITCILDTAINLASGRASSISHFFDYTIPYYVSSTYYILPSASLLLYYMKYWFCDTPDNTATNTKAHELIDTFSDVEGFERFLNENPKAREEMLNKINNMQTNGYIDKIDIFINVVYFSLRALHGVVLIVKANDLAAKETNEAVTDWSDFVSSVINVAYMMTMLIYNNWQKHKTESDKPEVAAVDIEQPAYGSVSIRPARV